MEAVNASPLKCCGSRFSPFFSVTFKFFEIPTPQRFLCCCSSSLINVVSGQFIFGLRRDLLHLLDWSETCSY